MRENSESGEEEGSESDQHSSGSDSDSDSESDRDEECLRGERRSKKRQDLNQPTICQVTTYAIDTHVLRVLILKKSPWI